MTGFSLILPLLFTLISLAIVAFLLKSLFGPVFGQTRGLTERLKFRQKQKLALEAERLIVAGEPKLAYPILADAFYLAALVKSSALIDDVTNHNLDILAKIIGIAENHARHLDNLAIVEDLIQSRAQLMRSYFEKISTKDSIKRKRRELGKDAPPWALDEFERQLNDLKDRLETNRLSLSSTIKQIFRALEDMSGSAEVTYH